MRVLQRALTFDDLLLIPAHSAVLPRDVSLKTRISRNVELPMPLVSAAMDTVTEARLATALASLGGLGIIHKSLPIARQAAEVAAVKAAKPLSFHGEPLLPAMDAQGRLRVGAAVGVGPQTDERVAALVAVGVDLLVVDTAHGHSQGVLQRVRRVKDLYPAVDVVGGNIATAEAARALVNAGADGVKVGIGPGSICTTRIVAGVGVPQMTAIDNVATALAGTDVPLIADGGVRFSGDVAKALAAGAHAVMLGSLFAGTDEAPGEVYEEGGRKFKAYRGMGSLSAMRHGAADRYFQEVDANIEKLVPEGVEARVAAKGPLAAIVYQLLGGVRASLGYCGCRDLGEFHTRASFVEITTAGARESHVHDVQIVKESPNYHVAWT